MRPVAIALLLAAAALGSACGSSREPEPASHPAAAAPSDEQVIREFRRIFAERKAVFRNRFLGISTLQNPMDAWIVQELITETKPELIVEAGTYHGGSAILWAMIQREVVPEGRVVTIDIEDKREPAARDHPIARERVDFLLGSSTAPEIVAEVRRRAEGKRVMVLLDSLHTADHVYAELSAYAPLVPVGGYVVVQDTLVGPIGGIRRFLDEHPEFEVDPSRERFILTNTRHGYLRRVR